MLALGQRFKNAWYAFRGREPTTVYSYEDYMNQFFGYYSSNRPDRVEFRVGALMDVLDIVYNKIAVDCSMIDITHVKVDNDGNYLSTVKDSLNDVLTYEANIDQTGREFIRDLVIKMLKDGVVAAIPTVTDEDWLETDSYKVEQVRCGNIVNWYPQLITVNLFNDLIGRFEEFTVPKRVAAIMENPFYYIMNDSNSTAQRLSRVLSLLDQLNTKSVKPPLDLLIKFPYATESPRREELAKRRKKDIENQLANSSTGIAYIDGSENIIQLNRPIENNLWEQANTLTEQLYNQLGLCKEIFNGTADEKMMLNYHNRTIAPILSTITENIERKWITKTARTQGHAIRYYRDPFRLVPVEQMAEITDKFRRNVILTANEVRTKLGFKPSDEEIANRLVNSNLNQNKNELEPREKDNSEEDNSTDVDTKKRQRKEKNKSEE